MSVDSIVYAPLSLPSIASSEILCELERIDATKWFWDSYRQVKMLAIHTEKGGASKHSVQNTGNPKLIEWTEIGLQLPRLRSYLSDVVFPLLDCKARVMILLTPSGQRIAEHIDCNLYGLNKRQHKIRVVLQGEESSLYFLSGSNLKDSKKVSPVCPKAGTPFVIDGSWPHGMINHSRETKLTLCIGAPWSGQGNDIYLKHLEESLDKYPQYILTRKNLERPKDSALLIRQEQVRPEILRQET